MQDIDANIWFNSDNMIFVLKWLSIYMIYGKLNRLKMTFETIVFDDVCN